MSVDHYDAIIIGARCAGSPTAMLLARQGRRVLVVDRATFPSDTVSTHVLHAPAMAALRRWGLADAVIATGCPSIDTYTFDFGAFTLRGAPRPVNGSGAARAPRRLVLDKILVDAAVAAGAEVHEGCSVDGLTVEAERVTGIRWRDASGTAREARGDVVIGADGRSSMVAKAVRPQQYRDKPMLQWSYYSYFRNLPVDGFEIFIRPERGFAAAPTNDGLTMLVVGWPYAEAAAYKADVEANFMRTLDLAPAFAERVQRATRVERFAGTASPNFFRRPYGPGWLLVGDAGYTKDPITAQGIPDAFADAERCTSALGDVLDGRRTFDDAMADYHAARDARVDAIYEFTTQLATLELPPPEVQQLLFAAHRSQDAMDQFVSVVAGSLSPAEFFAPDNIGRIMSAVAPA